MYIRFVVGGEDENHRLLTGIVTEARFLRDRGELTIEEEQRLESVYEWLNSNLPCPPVFYVWMVSRCCIVVQRLRNRANSQVSRASCAS